MQTIKVFLIDDDEDARELFQYALKFLPTRIDFSYATRGRDALLKLQYMQQPPNYIFLDLFMPGMSGMECLEAIKSNPALQHIPVIICTTRLYPEYEQQAQSLQANHFLIKPYHSAELTEVLTALLSNAQLPFLLQPKEKPATFLQSFVNAVRGKKAPKVLCNE